jgi:hypothetical protein
MTKRQFVVIAFRLFALYLGFTVVTNLGNILSLYLRSIAFERIPESLAYFATGFTILGALAVIALLWRRSEWIMEKIFRTASLTDPTTDISTEANDRVESAQSTVNFYETQISMNGLEQLGLCLLGLFEAFNALPSVIRDIVELTFPLLGFGKAGIDFQAFAIRVSPQDIITFILGVWLFLRPWQFQGWIEKFKPKEEIAEEERDPKLPS